jgi:ribosomal protein S8
MTSTYISLLHKIKIALQNKNLILKVKFTYNNLKILNFLLDNNFISGFEYKTQNKQKTLTIFLKYGADYLPALRDFSVVSKSIGKSHNKDFLKRQNTNFVVNLFSSNVTTINSYNNTKLLSKFR